MESRVPGNDPSGQEDAMLIAAVAGGDRTGLGRLYDRYAPVLMAVGMKVLGSRREAEDLVHDVFLEVWRRARDYDPERGSVRTWILMRARSRALDRRKSAGFARVVSVEDRPGSLEQIARMHAGGGAETDPQLVPDRATLRRALETLPREQQVVLELGYFEGLSSMEIAQRIDVPIGTVKSRVAAALGRLRAALGERAS
jgi:RNA polymerase sigma-70 factor (ECF subfamily)